MEAGGRRWKAEGPGIHTGSDSFSVVPLEASYRPGLTGLEEEGCGGWEKAADLGDAIRDS